MWNCWEAKTSRSGVMTYAAWRSTKTIPLFHHRKHTQASENSNYACQNGLFSGQLSTSDQNRFASTDSTLNLCCVHYGAQVPSSANARSGRSFPRRARPWASPPASRAPRAGPRRWARRPPPGTTRDVLFLSSYTPRRCPTSAGFIAPFCAQGGQKQAEMWAGQSPHVLSCASIIRMVGFGRWLPCPACWRAPGRRCWAWAGPWRWPGTPPWQPQSGPCPPNQPRISATRQWDCSKEFQFPCSEFVPGGR